jgi:predicted kinase/CheY-like chemotaxis protein
MWRVDQMTTPESGTESTSGSGQQVHGSGEIRIGAEKLRPILVITSGVQGVGKTTFAEALATRVDASIVSSDVLRVEVAGVVLKEGMLDYYTEFGRDYVTKLYGALLKRAHAHLSEGRSVICDASFERKEDREAAAELARSSGAAFLAVECLCWETVRYHRLRRRLEKEGRDDLLDETWRVYVDHARRFEEFGEEVPPESHLVIETSLRLEDWVEYVADRADLLRRVPADEVAELAARVSHTPRILIVDDDPQFLDVLESILGEDGFEVSRAGSGREAIERFDKGTFDLVVTDKRMPGGSGVDLARHIKQVKPATPIIMVSAFGAGDLGDPKDEGIFKFLRKPVRLPALMGAVEEALASEETPRPRDEDGT